MINISFIVNNGSLINTTVAKNLEIALKDFICKILHITMLSLWYCCATNIFNETLMEVIYE
jgi:hypothetical protein